MQKGSLWVKSQGLMPGRNKSCSSQKPSLRDPSWLRRVCSPRGSPGRSGVEKETSNWLKGDKALEDPTDLSASAASPRTRGRPRALSARLPRVRLGRVHCRCVCCPACSCAVSPIVNFEPTFTVSSSTINAFFTGDKDPGRNGF